MQQTYNYFALANQAAESAAITQSPAACIAWRDLADEYRKIAVQILQRETEAKNAS